MVDVNKLNVHARTMYNTSNTHGLVWDEPELAHEYDFDVENIIAKIEVSICNFLVFSI